MERENETWEGKGGLESGEQEHQEGINRQDYGNGSISAQFAEVKDRQGGGLGQTCAQQMS